MLTKKQLGFKFDQYATLRLRFKMIDIIASDLTRREAIQAFKRHLRNEIRKAEFNSTKNYWSN